MQSTQHLLLLVNPTVDTDSLFCAFPTHPPSWLVISLSFDVLMEISAPLRWIAPLSPNYFIKWKLGGEGGHTLVLVVTVASKATSARMCICFRTMRHAGESELCIGCALWKYHVSINDKEMINTALESLRCANLSLFPSAVMSVITISQQKWL